MQLRKSKSYLLIAFFFLSFAAHAMPGKAQDSSLVETLLEAGDLHYQSLDNQQAIQVYRQALEHAPTSYDVLSRLAKTVNEYGMDMQAENANGEAALHFEEAIGYALDLESHYPDSARTHYLLAATKRNLALIQGGRQKVRAGKEIEHHCLIGLALDSTDAAMHVLYGVFIREMATMSWLERALAHALVGEVPDGNKEQALDYIAHAVELDPSLHVAQFEAGLTYLSIGRRAEAIYYLEKAESMPAQTTQDNRNRQLARRMLERLRIE